MVNINQLMKQAQEMQQKMQLEQEKLAGIEYVGKSGGGMVSVTINGQFDMKKIDIDTSLLQDSEKEMLEDLIVAAYNDAKHKATAASANLMSGMMGNLGLPSGFKMPF